MKNTIIQSVLFVKLDMFLEQVIINGSKGKHLSMKRKINELQMKLKRFMKKVLIKDIDEFEMI